MDSSALANVLIAWSLRHLAATKASYRVTALEARSTALQPLAENVARVPDNLTCYEDNVGALLILTSEVCLVDHTGWYNQLKGVRSIMVSTRSPANEGASCLETDALRQSPEEQWILRYLA